MAIFKYKAMNQMGERIEGTYTASSKNEVMEMISSNNYYPLGIEEVIESAKIELSIGKKVKVKDIAIFCRQFYTMLNAGVTINSALNILSTQLTNKKLREVTAKMEEEVKKGQTLSESMREHKNVFPDILISMVETGEISGNLDGVLLRMSSHFEKEFKINNKVKSAMMYPAIVSGVAVIVVTGLLIFIVPTFINMFKSSGTELPLLTRMVLGLSDIVTNYGIFILIGLAIIVFFISRYFKTVNGKIISSKIKLSIPILKTLNKKVITSRFTRTLATLLSSGVSLVQSIEIVSTVVGNQLAQDALIKVKEDITKGEGLASAIKKCDLFPSMLHSMIMIGEEAGTLDDILNKTADFYDEELETSIQQATSMIEPLLIVIMGVVIGIGVIGLMMPMFDMFNTIK
ncbi:MAG: type II secretion system F family protein [Clostridiaceae bacterium]